MMKKIQILGLEVDNYSVRESILRAEGYLNGSSIKTIETVTMKMLTDAESHEVVGQALKEMDLTIIGEKEILDAANIATPQRMKETREHVFFHEFLKRIVRNRKRVYLLGEKADAIAVLEEYLLEHYSKIEIVGSAALEECQGDFENIINEVNGETADVVISIIPTPRQEEFLMEYKNKMGAKVWYGMGNHTELYQETFVKKFLKKFFHKHTLMRRMEEYRNKDEE